MSNPVALETTAFEVFRTSVQIEQLWGFAATVYVRIWRWHRQDMIDVKAGRVCAAALSEYLIKTPHTKARWCQRFASVFCFLWTLLGLPVLSFSSFTSLHSPPSPSFAFFSTYFSPIKLNQRPACSVPAVIVACRCDGTPAQWAWPPLRSPPLFWSQIKTFSFLLFSSVLMLSLSLALPTPDNYVKSLTCCGQDPEMILCHTASVLYTSGK